MASTQSNDLSRPPWQKALARYQIPNKQRSWGQVANTLIPYIALWYFAYRSLDTSYWLTLGISIVAAGFMVRIFIIFHDCGHGSFFESQKANNILGSITGVLAFTPYFMWRHTHAIHHATSGDLDRRGTGDIWTMTVKEYENATRWRRLLYRIYRHPLAMLGLGPLAIFLISYRFAGRSGGKRELASVYQTNLILLAILTSMHFTIGLDKYLLVQLPIILVGGAAGIWMFYVQHQYEGVYWERHRKWSYERAALQGSSFYKLPRLLQWFTGSIGYHHIHHLGPRIPNYYLETCHCENTDFQVKPITFIPSLKSATFRLWDEENHRLVGFDYRAARAE